MAKGGPNLQQLAGPQSALVEVYMRVGSHGQQNVRLDSRTERLITLKTGAGISVAATNMFAHEVRDVPMQIQSHHDRHSCRGRGRGQGGPQSAKKFSLAIFEGFAHHCPVEMENNTIQRHCV